MKKSYKVKMNSIGFANANNVGRGEKITRCGIIVSLIGIGISALGRHLWKRNETFFKASTDDQIKDFNNMYEEFDSACK